jgi:hypothetical protein
MAAAVGMILAPMLAPLLMPPPPPPAPLDIVLPVVLIGGAVVVAVVLTKNKSNNINAVYPSDFFPRESECLYKGGSFGAQEKLSDQPYFLMLGGLGAVAIGWYFFVRKK